MLALIAILIEPDATTATAFGPSGEIVGEARGATIDEVLAALPADPARIVVADDRAAPRGVGVGIVNVISAESASRALGLAGYDVVDTVAMNTHRFPPDRIEALLEAAPDVIFLAGGSDEALTTNTSRCSFARRSVSPSSQQTASAWFVFLRGNATARARYLSASSFQRSAAASSPRCRCMRLMARKARI